MKHFYNANPAVTVTRPAAKALGTALSSAKKNFMLMLLGFLLLVSGEGFGQATFTSNISGPWTSGSTWTKTNPGLDTDNLAYPTAGDIVIINNNLQVSLNVNAQCASVTIQAASGNNTTSRLTLANGAILEVNDFNIEGGNGQRAANFTANNGALKVSGTIAVTAQTGSNGTFDAGTGTHEFNNLSIGTNGIINAGTSTIRIKGVATNIGTFNAGTGTVEYNGALVTQAIAPLSYYNLTLSGTGSKTVSTSLQVGGNMSINENATFSTGDFSHTITGNLIVQSASAKITGNSGVTGTGLSVGGNLVNNGTITFQSRNLTVSGNFNNNLGSAFNAGSGTHTVSGNWTNAGTLNAGNSTVVLNGASKTITAAGTGAFNNLTVSNGETTVSNSISIIGNLDLSTKLITQDQVAVDLGETGALVRAENNNQYVEGVIKASRSIPAYGVGTQPFGNIGANISRKAASTTEPINLVIIRTTGKRIIADNGNASAKRYYDIHTVGGAVLNNPDLQVDLDFLVSELNDPLANQNMYRLLNYNPAGLGVFEGINASLFATTGIESTGLTQTYRIPTLNVLGTHTVGSVISPLPVELVSFKAQRHAQGVNLTWMTASEKDNSGFEVQVSTDGKKFHKVGFVKSDVGTSSITQRYTFLDTKAVSGTRYYRLAQIDLDGTTTYSAIRAVALDGANGEIAAYPNPFEEVVTVRLNGVEARKVNVTLTNAMGKVILEHQEETAGNTVTVNTSGITTKGIYMLHVVDNGEKHTFKVMKR